METIKSKSWAQFLKTFFLMRSREPTICYKNTFTKIVCIDINVEIKLKEM